MARSRRSVLTGLAAAGAATAAPAVAEARARKQPPADAVGLLYDTTLCVGCKACVVACADANGLPRDTGASGGLYQAPGDLNARTKNIIRLYAEGGQSSYVKNQCMHCVDPACVGACMLGALRKREFGVVTYDQDKCIGCRYCQIACPFGVPKFEWAKAAPKIVKCELCKHRLAEGRQPACTEVCPRQAVIFGTRAELLAEAHRRLREKPDLYVQKVYGETDAGGTQVLYVSHVPFEKLGFPQLGDAAVPAVQQSVQHGIYQGFAAPVALYALLGAVAFRNRRAQDRPAKDEEAGS
jgi:Fe-S-cluster-containing dehydrogenase component